MTITHPDRLLFPECGLTKGGLAAYYARVAPLLLPHVAGRALTVVRCPDGWPQGCFVQRHRHHLPGPDPDVVRVDGVDDLVGLVQHGVVELHPVGARLDRPDRPDRVVVDLDPGVGVAWPAVVAAAREAGELLDAAGLTPLVRTTGGRGVHVVAALARRATWAQVDRLARAVTRTLVDRAPGRFVDAPGAERRVGRIYVDPLRNGPAASAIGSWSVRARAGAPIAVPLPWDDLDRVPPGGFTVATLVLPAVDPWAAALADPRTLTARGLAAVGA